MVDFKPMNIGRKVEFKNHYLVTITVTLVLGKKLSMDSIINERSVCI